jgi:hypothetical protein
MGVNPLRWTGDSGRDMLKIELRKINTYGNTRRGKRGRTCIRP